MHPAWGVMVVVGVDVSVEVAVVVVVAVVVAVVVVVGVEDTGVQPCIAPLRRARSTELRMSTACWHMSGGAWRKLVPSSS